MRRVPPTSDRRVTFLENEVPRTLLAVNAVLATLYFVVLAWYFPIGNPILFGLLLAGEVFHMWQVFTFMYTVWNTDYLPEVDPRFSLPVDVFITVCGEPVEIVERTARAALAMTGEKQVHLLNDGLVAKKSNWRDMEALAVRLQISCITRTVPGGAKAGNINNALRRTTHPLVAIFDADHIPHPDFLAQTVPYFERPLMGFVQTPQFYRNHGENYITQSSWEQQEIFFGPICKGKNRHNAATMCGTNMVIRREALSAVGGMCRDSIAEDFVTGLLMHRSGYESVYVPKVLAEGLATEDLGTYATQQFRWARGALDVVFRWNPLFMRGLTFAQRIQYLSSASFYLSGLVVLIDALLPIVYFYSGLVPVRISGMLLAAVFLPYFFTTLYILQRTSNFTFTFASLCFSMGSLVIHLKALGAAILRTKSAFVVTSKQREQGSYLRLAAWHIGYVVLVIVGIPVALVREGFSASLVNNSAWALLNIAVFIPFIWAALPERSRVREQAPRLVPVT